jgi:hypothetical protein
MPATVQATSPMDEKRDGPKGNAGHGGRFHDDVSDGVA